MLQGRVRLLFVHCGPLVRGPLSLAETLEQPGGLSVDLHGATVRLFGTSVSESDPL